MRMPTQKEYAAGVGGLLVWLLVIALKHFWNIDIPADAEGALIGGVTILIAKLVPLTDQDILDGLNNDIAHAGVIMGKVDPDLLSGGTTPPSPETQKIVTKAITRVS